MANSTSPDYENFGKELKRIRTAAKRSLADVSQAIELDPAEFSQLEDGRLKPSQEIVSLLINHFDLAVSTASRLWRLAGYDQQLSFTALDGDSSADEAEAEDQLEAFLAAEARPALLAVNDNRAAYTDMFNLRANSYGVVVNFLQGFSQDGPPLSVGRVGMSLDHAARLAKALNETVSRVGRKSRPTAEDQPGPRASTGSSDSA